MAIIAKSPENYHISRDTAIDYLLSGVADVNVRRVLRLREFGSVHSLIEAARTLDRDNELNKSNHNRTQRVPTKSEIDNCKFNTKFRPFQNNEQRTINGNAHKDELRKPSKAINCFRCNQEGHFARDCHVNTKMEKKAHFANCIIETKWPSKTITVVDALVFNEMREVMVDSGCERSIIKKCAVPEGVNIVTRKDDKCLRVIDSEVEIVGSVDIEIKIGNFTGFVNAAVVNVSPFDIICGCDWRKSANVVISSYPDASIELTYAESKGTMVGVILSNFEVETPTTNNDLTEQDTGDQHKKLYINVDTTLRQEIDSVVNGFSNIVTDSHKDRIRSLLLAHKKVFTTAGDDLGCCTNFECSIRLKDNIPVFSKPYRYSFADRQFINETVKDWLEKNVIRESHSEYASPVVLVRNDSSSTTPRRLCIDYRALNNKIADENYPMQIIDDVIERVMAEKPNYFNVMDIKTAFLTIKIRPGDEHLTSFVTQDGQFEFLRMPFGLKIAPRFMQRIMDVTYKGIRCTTTYIDDVCQGGVTVDEVIDRLEEALIVTEERGLKMSLRKCQLIRTSINFLGYVVTSEGKIPDPKRVAAIDNYNNFECVKDVRRFLAFAAHYRKFIKDFARLSKPLNALLRKSTDFQWTKDCRESAQILKEKLKSPPILGHFRIGLPIEVHVDASLTGLGAVLVQLQGKDEKVIEYASCKVSDTDQKLHSNDLECLAVHWAVTKKFRIYLYGAPRFTVITDNWTVSHLNSKKTLSRKFARWIIELQEFDFKVQHRCGAKNIVADALSRQVSSELYCMAIIYSRDQKLRYLQQVDKQCVDIMCILSARPTNEHERKIHQDYSYVEGLLCSQRFSNGTQQTRVVVPQQLQVAVMKMCHDKSGHGDFKRTFAKISKRYCWCGYTRDVKKYVSSCEICQRMNLKPSYKDGIMTPRRIPQTPFEVISVDHFGPLEKVQGFKYVIVAIDHCTRWMIAKAQKSTKSKEFIKFLDDELVNKYGSPMIIISDRGTCFTSDETFRYFESVGIEHHTSPPYFPEANGLAERAVKTIKDTLRKVLKHSHNWVENLGKTLMAINASKCSSSGESPFFLLYGFEPKLDGELFLGSVIVTSSRKRQLADLLVARSEAIQHLQTVQSKQADKFNEHRNKSRFKVGDRVLYSTGSRKGMFGAMFDGPFTIAERVGERVYKLVKDGDPNDTFHERVAPAERLKFYKEREELDEFGEAVDRLFDEDFN